jgi:hypothetical protein
MRTLQVVTGSMEGFDSSREFGSCGRGRGFVEFVSVGIVGIGPVELCAGIESVVEETGQVFVARCLGSINA